MWVGMREPSVLACVLTCMCVQAYRERDGVADEQGRGRARGRGEADRRPPVVARGGGRVQLVQVSREGVAELDAGRVVAERGAGLCK